jgi:hypothetical protein
MLGLEKQNSILLISNNYNFNNQIWRLKKYLVFFVKIMDWFVWLGGSSCPVFILVP